LLDGWYLNISKSLLVDKKLLLESRIESARFIDRSRRNIENERFPVGNRYLADIVHGVAIDDLPQFEIFQLTGQVDCSRSYATRYRPVRACALFPDDRNIE